MSLPKNITKDHLLKAILRIDSEGIPNDAQSRQYDVVHNGERYPPKLIVSYANSFANNVDLDRNTFEGGAATPCFKLLKKEGFIIKPKSIMDFSPVLKEFLKQANSRIVNLKVSAYPKEYNDLTLKVSFGQGAPAAIPWMAFLQEGQSVSNGIYPVFLYFKEYQLLILAYGISETNMPGTNWNVKAKTITEVLEGEYSKSVKRYGNSFVFAVYSINPKDKEFGLKSESINQDINTVISTYKGMRLKGETMQTKNKSSVSFNYKEFKSATDKANLKFSDQLILRFTSSLCTKPFVILTGLSGSGKTKLAQSFSLWLSEHEDQVCVVPVGADWTNREPLLGFPNALVPDSYVKPENGVLDLLIKAGKIENGDKPYFLILDEMNLSHVERYFADFLSAMESSGYIPLHSDKDRYKDDVPNKLQIPTNFFIIGTVNIDETTYMFSPKVLDRANVIEFRVTNAEMNSFLSNPYKVDLQKLTEKGGTMGKDFLRLARLTVTEFKDSDVINPLLMTFFQELKKAGAEFGYRTASEIYRLISLLKTLDNQISTNGLIDIAIMQKLLPKLHGSRRKLEPILKTLITFCIANPDQVSNFLDNHEKIDYSNQAEIFFPISLEKIVRMYNNAIKDGFTSYAEA